ncbi:Ent-kaurene oxidase [Cladorrhinum sp. PSN259]|nr:Ent-kaurene oxidase [Cladorrhinum sp. PSN259]
MDSNITNAVYLQGKVLGRVHGAIETASYHRLGPWVAAVLLLTTVVYWSQPIKFDEDGLVTVNRRWSWEPAFFSRIRWISNAPAIMAAADEQFQGKPYRLARGDTDQIILPPSFIPELNHLNSDVLNSRESHAFGLLGHLTGMGVVRKTSFHVRVLLSHISPALPSLFALTGMRISKAIQNDFPQQHEWTVMKPSKAIVRCVSESIALALFGAEMTANNPELVHLTHEHTNNVFQVCFAMRCVPEPLQALMVWLVPARWKLISGWRRLRHYVVPSVLAKKAARSSSGKARSAGAVNPDVISWMVEAGKNELERDSEVLTTLVGSIAAGSTYSITNFCCRTIMDMVAHPDVLDAVRAEIRAKHAEINGKWDMAALASLEKLESAMKESARLTPGTLLVYSRVVKKDHVLSNGLKLKKGQFITMSGAQRTMDPLVFEEPTQYKGLRFCAPDKIEEHRTRPFSSIDTDILGWGAGRWACPGRLISDMAAKILLVRLLDEYDFAFVGGKPLSRSVMHEFLFFHPENEMMEVQTVVEVFLGAKRDSHYEFQGSVIAADADATTYLVRCQYGLLNMPGFPTTSCNLEDPPWTVTEGPSTMVGVISTAIDTVTALLAETCEIKDRTAAYCSYTFTGISAGTTTSTAYPTTITGDLFYPYPITITAGAEKLPPAPTAKAKREKEL